MSQQYDPSLFRHKKSGEPKRVVKGGGPAHVREELREKGKTLSRQRNSSKWRDGKEDNELLINVSQKRTENGTKRKRNRKKWNSAKGHFIADL